LVKVFSKSEMSDVRWEEFKWQRRLGDKSGVVHKIKLFGMVVGGKSIQVDFEGHTVTDGREEIIVRLPVH